MQLKWRLSGGTPCFFYLQKVNRIEKILGASSKKEGGCFRLNFELAIFGLFELLCVGGCCDVFFFHQILCCHGYSAFVFQINFRYPFLKIKFTKNDETLNKYLVMHLCLCHLCCIVQIVLNLKYNIFMLHKKHKTLCYTRNSTVIYVTEETQHSYATLLCYTRNATLLHATQETRVWLGSWK